MQKLIIANWKMNPATVREAVKLARAEDKRSVVVAPPFPFLKDVGAALKRARLGAQDVFWLPYGAYTGEVSARQLKRTLVSYVILGHSERRALGETDREVQKKVKAALAEGLTPVLCVGEPWNVRKKGLAAAQRYVATQLRAALRGTASTKRVIVAYEPVWAIGTGKADKPSDTATMARSIKRFRVGRVLYGGSVTPKNAPAFFRENSIDGALVGGASLRPRDFMKIITAAHVSHR
jgi:triosephosphate isomerase